MREQVQAGGKQEGEEVMGCLSPVLILFITDRGNFQQSSSSGKASFNQMNTMNVSTGFFFP